MTHSMALLGGDWPYCGAPAARQCAPVGMSAASRQRRVRAYGMRACLRMACAHARARQTFASALHVMAAHMHACMPTCNAHCNAHGTRRWAHVPTRHMAACTHWHAGCTNASQAHKGVAGVVYKCASRLSVPHVRCPRRSDTHNPHGARMCMACAAAPAMHMRTPMRTQHGSGSPLRLSARGWRPQGKRYLGRTWRRRGCKQAGCTQPSSWRVRCLGGAWAGPTQHARIPLPFTAAPNIADSLPGPTAFKHPPVCCKQCCPGGGRQGSLALGRRRAIKGATRTRLRLYTPPCPLTPQPATP